MDRFSSVEEGGILEGMIYFLASFDLRDRVSPQFYIVIPNDHIPIQAMRPWPQ